MGKSPCLKGKSTISTGPFSIANCLAEGKHSEWRLELGLRKMLMDFWRFDHVFNAGCWFGTFFITFHILGISSSQLINIFFRGVGQPTRMILKSSRHIKTLDNV